MNANRVQARNLRQKGKSIKYIAQKLHISQSSVSLWTRDIKLSSIQREELKKNTHSPETIEKRRKSRLKSEEKKRLDIFNSAYKDINHISERELWLLGISLYWAEGGKTQRMVRFSNGDPSMIKLMIKFFKEICGIPISEMKAHIHIHESLDTRKAEKYWQDITGIPASNFYKTYNKPNKSSHNKRHSLPNGVCDIYAGNFELFIKIQAWTKAIYDASIR